MLAEQERRTNEALVPGNWVRTRAGFYGTVVEVSGNVVTAAFGWLKLFSYWR